MDDLKNIFKDALKKMFEAKDYESISGLISYCLVLSILNTKIDKE